MPLLEVRGITRDFPGVRALDSVSLDVEEGEVHALCGENGAGKSTLIKVLSGFYPHGSFEGEIRLAGRPVRFRDIRDAERHGIAVIAQELALVPEMTVAENLFLGREPVSRGRILWDRVRAGAREALARVGAGLDPQTRIAGLGVGQQQMVVIARALDKRSRVLVLDEPTAALPEEDARRLLALVTRLSKDGVASIYVSHRISEVLEIADRITVLRDGHTVGSAPKSGWDRRRLVSAMVGRELAAVDEAPKTAGNGPVAMTVSGWRVEGPTRGSRAVVDGIAFDLRRGEILGIAGLVGSGRTALATSLFGISRSRVAGRIAVSPGSERPPFRHPAEAIAAGLALVAEDRQRSGLVLSGSVLDNLTLATLARYRKGPWLDDPSRSAAAGEEVSALAIKTPSLESRVATLSGGTQQKVVLGRWLLARPRVMILDEPTRGVDVGAKAEIHAILRRLAVEGMAILLASSDLPELLALSHRVLVLRAGRPAAQLDGDAATPESVMVAATGAA
jgi:D-xylose transport system ATP-binding protein